MKQFNINQERLIERKADTLNSDALDDPIKYFIKYLINYEYYKKYGSGDENDIKFLKQFEVEIINCIKTDLKELHEPEKIKLIQLRDKDTEIIKNIEQIIRDYRQEYSISENEIVPHQNMNHIIY